MKFLNVLLLLLFSIPSIAEDIAFGTLETSALYQQQNINRLLLIGFEDEYINRIELASLSSPYRRRGAYNSSTWSRNLSSQIEEQYNIQKLAEWPMTEVGIHCIVYLIPANLSIEKTIAQLAKDTRIDIVQKMHQFQTRHHAYNDPYYQLQENMHNMQVDLAHLVTTGRDVSIAMIDTGVDIHHPDLVGQIDKNENFASGISPSFTTDKHGTAIAGILVARSDNETGIIGVAPNANLIALKACWPNKIDSFEASCNSFTLALAVNTAIKLGVKVLNMSLSGPHDPLLEILIKKAIEKGTIVIAADPGKNSNGKRFPASMTNVIPVQTTKNSANTRRLSSLSINAQGDNILTTLPYGTYDFVSGSSLSAAQITGIVALMLELKSDLELDKIKTILQKAAFVSTPTKNDNLVLGTNANNAILQLCNKITCPEITYHK